VGGTASVYHRNLLPDRNDLQAHTLGPKGAANHDATRSNPENPGWRADRPSPIPSGGISTTGRHAEDLASAMLDFQAKYDGTFVKVNPRVLSRRGLGRADERPARVRSTSPKS